MNILLVHLQKENYDSLIKNLERMENPKVLSTVETGFFNIKELIKKNDINVVHFFNINPSILLKIYCKLKKIVVIFSNTIKENKIKFQDRVLDIEKKEDIVFLDKIYSNQYVKLIKYDIPILMYHRIIDQEDDKGCCYTYTLLENFKNQMHYLKKNKFIPLTFKDLEKMNYKNRFDKKCVIITFDDGYEDNYRLAFPILKELEFKAVIYLVTRENYNRWDVDEYQENKFPMMTKEMIKEMHEYGIEFGGHTLNHSRLSTITKEEIKKQIFQSKEDVEDIINEKALSFAYPYGLSTDYAKEIVKEAGYIYAVTTNFGSECFSDDLYYIRRVAIFPKNKILHFRRKVSGKYNFIAINREKRKKRSIDVKKA